MNNLEVWTNGTYDALTRKRVSWRYVIGLKGSVLNKRPDLEIARIECGNKEPEQTMKQKAMAEDICRRFNQYHQLVSFIKSVNTQHFNVLEEANVLIRDLNL